LTRGSLTSSSAFRPSRKSPVSNGGEDIRRQAVLSTVSRRTWKVSQTKQPIVPVGSSAALATRSGLESGEQFGDEVVRRAG
jgi:hypothetical protein